MPYLMGIDVGTTGTRAIVVDESGRLRGSATLDYPLSTPKPLWAEQDPEDWWRAACGAIRGALDGAGIAGTEIGGIGLSGQMHGLVLLDSDGKVLRPAILWCDGRTQRECDWITETVGASRLIDLTCNPALVGFTAPKIVWVRDHEPQVYERARKALLPKDYLRYRLTGAFATEVSDASGTLLLDVRNRRWSREMLDALHIDSSLLPEVYESPVVSARVSASAAEATGLTVGTPVVGGAGDQAAGGVGNGIVTPGLISSTIGSSGVVFAFTDQPWMDPKGRIHTFCHAVPGKWHVMGVTLGAGLSLRWFRDQLAPLEVAAGQMSGIDPYVLITRQAADAPAGCEGLVWLPYVMGERTPHLDPSATGVLFGVTGRHSRSHVVRAVMEGVAYSLRDSLEILRDLGVPLGEVRFSGGGARSPLWRQIRADVFGLTGVTLNVEEGPAFGVALLAGVGIGVFGSVEEACAATLRPDVRVEPDATSMATYDRYYQVYRDLYPALKPVYARASAIVAVQ